MRFMPNYPVFQKTEPYDNSEQSHQKGRNATWMRTRFLCRMSDLMWTSVWSGNLLSSEVISLTHCIVRWWGGPSSKNGVTWPRFVWAASAFLVSSQKWSVLFFMFDLSSLHHVLNWQVFTSIFAVLLPTSTLYCKIISRDLTTQTLGVICHTMANTCCTKYAVSNFNRSKDKKGVQNFEIGHVT